MQQRYDVSGSRVLIIRVKFLSNGVAWQPRIIMLLFSFGIDRLFRIKQANCLIFSCRNCIEFCVSSIIRQLTNDPMMSHFDVQTIGILSI